MDASKFSIPEGISYSREDIIRASLECLRRSIPKKLASTPVTLIASKSDTKWLKPIVADYNKSDRGSEFFKPSD